MVHGYAVRPFVLESVTRRLASLDPRERRADHGRLILAMDCLYFVQGWETHQQAGGGGGLMGALLDLAEHSRDVIDTAAEGARMLAQVQPLRPEEQVRAVAGSVSVAVGDIESASLSFFTSILTVVTETHGEVLSFEIERQYRKQVQAWLRSIPRARAPRTAP
ncbi:hypothetical protein [Nannocystis bainbridge]|uniref:Roadblock/LAMTOR2 domain-containing protein n=1 Tax=Nannocystis bainbridge TaxID=2995303 RepID=A0ABT5EF11_9BACT|nr:hypothetical protein [Nannocystis bainbridge]MDC0723528.1 hypothetical protein [Nannocystis bainbridge]